MAEITRVATEYTVAVDVAAMEREGASEYGRGWTVASMLALVGDLLERGYGPVLYRELMAVREISRETLETAQSMLGVDGAAVRAGVNGLRSEMAMAVRLVSPPPRKDLRADEPRSGEEPV